GLQSAVYNSDGSSKITQLATGISSVVADLDNLEIGGRNLLRGTADFNTDFWENVSTAIPSTRDSRYKQVRVIGDFSVAPITTMSVQGWNFEVGEDYVVSVYAKSEVSGNKIGLTAQPNAVYFEPQVVDVWEWKRFVWKFTATSSNLSKFRFETRNDEKVWITQPKIEKGSVPTDWSPAPEDVQSQITQLSSNINMRVSKGELMSQINIEAGRTLIQSDKLYLDSSSVVFSGKAFIPGAVIENASIDGAKIANATIGSAKIANLDVNKISGNKAQLVKARSEERRVG